MEPSIHPEPAVVVIFGAGGDLTWRKLVPALYDLFLDKWLPNHFAVMGVGRKGMSIDEFRHRLRDGVDTFSRRGKTDDKTWGDFATHLVAFISAEFDDPAGYAALAEQLSAQDREWGAKANRIFHLATPPSLVQTVVQQLGKARLSRNRERARIVVEKPFGRDLESARALNQLLTGVFEESQIYRIDHYLGKETVQNLLAFRFANALFEPIWDRRYIDHVQITVAEQVGVEHRGGYYERAGALRDMVQNHLMQILCLIAMEPPVSFDADEIRNRKLDVLRAVRPIPEFQLHRFAVRGQYGAGWLQGQHVSAYRDEPRVDPDSTTETFAALKLFVDNWRWQDVPFYLRTGKRLPSKVSEVFICFRPAPHQSFPPSAAGEWRSNRLAIRIQPAEGIHLQFQAKQPGPTLRLSRVEMHFCYEDVFKAKPPEAYETLLLDVMRGDATLFMRADQVEAAWSVITPVLEAWETTTPNDFPNYQASTWGPEAAEVLIAQDGRSWLQPILEEGGGEDPSAG
ncbi:MAG: glucose-6-phosphate dehydrogenase [Chloroflexi bacterium]|nr:glucose-6-phosphate dehydrogenase [Chloroflexota bacterium]MDA8218402.1 glucose-6-phosphate dehydrogenase [Dehalococcoidales bacterium]